MQSLFSSAAERSRDEYQRALSKAGFYAGSGPHDTSDRIIYNQKTGALMYDKDGIGFYSSVEFAKLAPHLHLTNLDFLIV